MNDQKFEELCNRVSSATPLGRLNHAEQRVVLRWLADAGFISFTDEAASLERAPTPPRVSRRDGEGRPIAWDGETEFFPQATARPRRR